MVKRAGSTAVFAATSMIAFLSACGGTGASVPSPTSGAAPIRVGASLVWTGDFAASGQSMAKGYELWAKLLNQHGGLLGRQVTLDILHDDGTVAQTGANYEKLASADHVDLLLGPFNDDQTVAAATVAAKHGLPLIDGTGTSAADFRLGLTNMFAVSLSVDRYMTMFVDYIAALPAAARPSTAAYETDDDAFSQDQVDAAKVGLEAVGVRTVFSGSYPSSGAPPAADVQAVARSRAQVFVEGPTVGLSAMLPFLTEFKKQHDTPQAWVATSGPDAGADFLHAFGLAGSEAIMVPNGSWFPAITTFGNAEFTKAYTSDYGGGGSDIPSEAVQAYSVGQVLQQAVTSIGSLNAAALLVKLQAGATWNSIQGPVKFAADGQNTSAQAFLYQWQHGASVVVLPASAAQARPEFPKPPIS